MSLSRLRAEEMYTEIQGGLDMSVEIKGNQQMRLDTYNKPNF